MTSGLEKQYVEVAQRCSKLQPGDDPALEKILFDINAAEALAMEESGLQASCSVHNVQKARRLAEIFIADTGELLLQKLKTAQTLLGKYSYTITYGCEEERKRDQHLLKAISFLLDSIEAQRLIKKMTRPLTNRLAENALRNTLLLPENEPITDVHVRRATIAAFLTTLRQSLGSCFATAPAILVQEEQPLVFLHDLDELMSTAKLRRVVAGNEYSVPMSSSWGQGDLKKTIVLSLPLLSSQPIWRSPSLLSTLITIGILPPNSTQQTLFSLIEGIFTNHVHENKWITTSVEDLFKQIILAHLHLSEAGLQEFLHRPKSLQQTTLVVTQTQSTTKDRIAQEKLFQQYFTLSLKARDFFNAQADCALLKTWEFTIASFAEVKFDLCRWNFYSSLGINWDDTDGIGNVLYEIAKQRVEETNRDLEEYKEKYDAINTEVEYLSRRLQQASSEAEVQWLKVEYQARQVEQYNIQQLCDMATEKTNKISNIHQFLIDQYDRLMREYFQEIYDADLHDVQQGPFDDSPAGFRLIYKHGRTNPSLWTKITSLDEYVEALVSFLTITEQDLLHAQEIQGIEAEFSSIITQLTNHVRSDAFLESAFARTARAHGVLPTEKPLQHLDAIEKKPWVYTSGGSMNSLVSSYFGLDGSPEEMGRWVENEVELLAYLIDTTRLSMARAGRYRPARILMHSPTHAFSLLPMHDRFEEAWSGDAYSYAWIKNNVIHPGQTFYSSCVLDQYAVTAFCEYVAQTLPKEIRKRFLNEVDVIPGFLRPFDLAKEIQKLFMIDTVLHHYAHLLNEISLESMLYESVPYTPFESLIESISSILSEVLPQKYLKNIEENIRKIVPLHQRQVRSKELLLLVKTLVIRLTGQTRFENDIFENILRIMRMNRLLPPAPLLVADSNWVKEYFAFVVSPVSQQVELWSVNAYGTEGKPIMHWKMWLDGSRKEGKWGLLINPNQYKASIRNSIF